MFLGYPPPPNTVLPQANASLTKEERERVFSEWATSYFRHPFYHSTDSNQEKTPSSLLQTIPEGAEKYLPASYESFTENDVKAILDLDGGDRDMQIFVKLLPQMHELKLGSFLLDHDSNSAQLPDLRVLVLYGDATIWVAIWAAWKLEEEMKAWRKEQKQIRATEFIEAHGTNHYVSEPQNDSSLAPIRYEFDCFKWFWDDPSAFLSKVAEIV